MQVFKVYFKLLNHYKGSMILFFSIFMFISIVLSGANSSKGESGFVATKLKIGIVNEDEGSISKEIKKYFKKEHEFTDMKRNNREIVDELYWKRKDYILVIPKGFEEKLSSGDVKDITLECVKVPGNASNGLFETELNMYISKLSSLIVSGYSIEDATKEIDKLRDQKSVIKMAQPMNKNQNDRFSLFLGFTPYLFISLGVVGVGTILLVFNQREVKDRMECSSTSLKERVTGMVGGILLYGSILYVIVFAVGAIMTKGAMFADYRLPYFLLNVFVMLLFGLSLGFFVGVIAKNDESINGWNNILGLGLCFLGGVFLPQEFMGESVKKVGQLLPTFWYIDSNNQISSMVKATSVFTKDIMMNSAFIVCHAVAIFAITLVIMAIKRKRTE